MQTWLNEVARIPEIWKNSAFQEFLSTSLMERNKIAAQSAPVPETSAMHDTRTSFIDEGASMCPFKLVKVYKSDLTQVGFLLPVFFFFLFFFVLTFC